VVASLNLIGSVQSSARLVRDYLLCHTPTLRSLQIMPLPRKISLFLNLIVIFLYAVIFTFFNFVVVVVFIIIIIIIIINW